ncbi:MAG: hypothetical protein IJD90_05360 [Clostridia bacterium]|nr:hypothetical protein [Clostridia bacterium]
MKKSSFVALILGTVSGVIFALGMCMTLLPEWNLFKQGIVFGSVGLLVGIITLVIWCKMENKKLPKFNKKLIGRISYITISVLLLGFGMCLCLVWQQFVLGTIVGLFGIIMLLFLIPMFKGLK